MKRSTSLLLSATLVTLAPPGHIEAHAEDGVQPSQADTILVEAGQTIVDDSWTRTYKLYADPDSGDVWGEGHLEDLNSVDPLGFAGRWLSYQHHNGDFTFWGDDDGSPFRAYFGPDDVAWTWDAQSGWNADIAHPNDGPQAIWVVVAIVVVATVILAGDSGCSCGHNGGTANHPGTNHPGK
jgi:hypothetical protein